MGHGGEVIVCSPPNHHSATPHPQSGGHSKKSGQMPKGSKVKKAHSNNSSTQPKPINKGRPQQQQPPYNLMKQQSLPARAGGFASPRQKSYSPPTLHPMPGPGADKVNFYAGARFETHPSHIGLPVPPSHWTAPQQRSQSQPSSPVPCQPQKGFSVDLAKLFGHSDCALEAASFPGVRIMEALTRKNDKASPRSPQAQDETLELKKALGIATLASPARAPHGSDMSPTKYQDISDQLKNLLKVAA